MTTTGERGWRPLRKPDRPRSQVATTAFARLAVPHALAVAGDTLTTMALAGSLFFSITPSAARGRVTLSLLLTMAPFALVAPFLGPAIDRSRRGRRTMVVASCLGRALACLVMARELDTLLLFPAAFTALVLSKAYTVAKSSLVPSVVDDDHGLVEANSRLAVVAALVGFAAAVPGVGILGFLGSEWVLGLAAVAFVAAAVKGVAIVERHPSVPDGGRAGDAEVRSLGIVAAAVAMAVLRTLVGFLTFLIAFAFRNDGAPSWWFGVVLAASMAATLGGAVVAPRLRDWLREERILLGCLGLVAVVGLAVARFEGRLWSAVMAAAVGLAATVGKLAFDALVQRDAPDAVRGRSFARFEAGFQLVWVVGALLPVVVTTPLRQGYVVIAVAALTSGAFYLAISRWLGRAGRPRAALSAGPAAGPAAGPPG